MKKFGIDVSRWQGDFDFEYAKNQNGVQFAILKAGGADDGLYQDRKFEQNYEACCQAALDKGAYFYGNAKSIRDAELEADYFLSLLAGKTFEYPVWYDVEGTMLEADALTDLILAFLDKVKAAGYTTGLYASESPLNSRIAADRIAAEGHYIWAARYSKTPPALRGNVKVDLWQFGGSVNYLKDTVIAGQTCDQNYCYTDFSAGAAPVQPDRCNTYVVQAGDCLSVIAERFNVDLYLLAELNAIKDINRIDTGQILRLPETGNQSAADCNDPSKSGTYIVQDGDSLWSIAERLYGNGIRYTELAEKNGIADASLIYPGQELCY